MRTLSLTTLLFAGLFPVTTFAVNYSIDHLPYIDVPDDFRTQVAVSVLTDMKLVAGNPDGTFRSNATLNRAEFTKIAMGLSTKETKIVEPCFPDVQTTAWYSKPVCKAKALGYVSGNVVEGKDASQWLFAPESNVQYVEALKILYEIFGIDTQAVLQGGNIVYHGQWYDAYVLAAMRDGTVLPEGFSPDHLLTRGEMARLVLRFLAHADDEIDVLDTLTADSLSANTSTSSSLSSVSSKDSEESIQSSSVSSESSHSSVSSIVIFDTNPDTTVNGGFLLLGGSSQIMGGAEVFSEKQPLVVEQIVVRLIAEASSIQSFSIFDHDKKMLGTAYIDTSFPGQRQYVLRLSSSLHIPKSETFSFYVRGNIKSDSQGGESGDIAQIEKLGVIGYGEWNNKDQSEFSIGNYEPFQSAESVILLIDNPGSTNDVLIAGQQIRLGSFRFKGITGHGSSRLEITDLVVRVDQTGGVVLTNVEMGADGLSERIPCSVVPGQITCNNIPAQYGSLDDQNRIITFYGDIAITGGLDHSSLQLKINDPGSPTAAGDVTWTDGVSVFTWVEGDLPLARSTYFKN